MAVLFPTFIMENDNLVKEGLRHILSNTPFQPSFLSWSDADLERAQREGPRIFIVIAQERERLTDQVSTLRSQFDSARIVVLLDESYREAARGLFDKGATAALSILISPEGLIRTLHALISDDILVAGATLLTPGSNQYQENATSAFGEAVVEREPRRLSSREVEILERIVKGDSNKHIARHFDIAEATVKAHVKAILRKIGASNRTQAAIWSMNAHGVRLLDPQDDDGSAVTDNLDDRDRLNNLAPLNRFHA